jgi:hypothetical protein
MISVFPGGMGGRIGNIVWCCGSDQHANQYQNSLYTGHARFGNCLLLKPAHADTLCSWLSPSHRMRLGQ